jgi:OOP family OmpA-OmpF porin
MSQPGRWLWGLVPLALLWGAGNLFLGEVIERDVGRRAVAVAAAAAGEAPGARPVTARIEGRDVTISGEALSADGAARAIARLRAEFGVRRALGGLSQVVAQKPYSWSASRRGEVVTLTGFVPDETTARSLVAVAEQRLLGLRVEDRQSFAFGAPAGFAPMAAAVLAELPKLAAGKVALDDTRFCIEGTATTPDAYLALRSALANLPREGFQPVACTLEAPSVSPYRFSAEKLSQEAVRIEGFVPPALREAAQEALRRAFPAPVTVEDLTKPASGEPPAFLTRVTRALGDLARLRQGRAELEGDAYRLSGEGPDTFEACQALRLQIAQGDGPDSVAQATIACPPEPPPPPPPVESLIPALPAIPDPIFLPSDLPPPAPAPVPETPAPRIEAAPAPAVTPSPPPPPAPVALAWSATRGPDGVTLQGQAPDAAARDALLAKARALGLAGAVTDRLAIEANLREAGDYAEATGFALELLGRLKAGTVTLADKALGIVGEVADGAAWAELDALLRRRPLPAGLSLTGEGAATVVLRPYRLSLSVDRSGLSLTGYLPDARTREALRALVEASALKGLWRDETQLVPGAPQGFAAAAAMAVGNLLRLDLGSAEIQDDLVTLRGLTCRDLIQREVETSAASGLPAGFRVDAAIGLRQTGCVVDPPATCQNDLDMLTKRNTVLFAQGTSVVALDAPTERVIGEAVAILNQCPAARITIEGHANNDGERGGFDNLDLSARRALRVRDELVRRGIDPARLETQGFGTKRPLVPHGQAEARAMNRRVQFTVAK